MPYVTQSRSHCRPVGMFATIRPWLAAMAALSCLAAPKPAGADTGVGAAPVYTGHYIVRWRDADAAAGATGMAKPAGASAASSSKLSGSDDRLLRVREATGLDVAVKRQMGGTLQLLSVGGGSGASGGTDPEAVAARLRQDPRIADAVPDRWLRLHDTVPNDPLFSTQPYIGPPSQVVGGANLLSAWDRSRGSSSIVIAVVDTGFLPHPDLAARLVPGYDFISNDTVSNDSQPGRDADPTDPGDFVPVGYTCPTDAAPRTTLQPSSWHGTRVASVLGALTNNNTDIAGVDWNARIQPVRVSGRCGALLSDTVDGMRWAGGLDVPGVPTNATPARVINVSLGGGTCSSVEQQAINDLTARGVTVVAATGNNHATAVEAPADCTGVIAVTAHANDGENASYANVGPQVALSAPGGGCGNSKVMNNACTVAQSYIRTLSNTGQTMPVDFTVTSSQGTSFAAPMVSGVVALMLSVNSSLSPAQAVSALKSSARPHPAGTYCTNQTGLCGAGLLDANGALALAANTPPPAAAAPTPAPAASSGGGGGGAVAPWTAALLAMAGLMAFAARKRRQVT